MSATEDHAALPDADERPAVVQLREAYARAHAANVQLEHLPAENAALRHQLGLAKGQGRPRLAVGSDGRHRGRGF
jgi:hypothetical protein